MAKVSVIVPVYNIRDYLPNAVESLLNQTEQNLEIILVDDGSTDGSGALCDKYAEQDPRIWVIHKENGGLSSARSAGVEAATSSYILFLDGDDYLLPCAVSRALNAVESYPCDFVQFLYQEKRNGEVSENVEPTDSISLIHGQKACFELLYRLGGPGASACTKLIRVDLAREIPFRSIRHEDEQWCTDAFQKNLTVTYLPEALYIYVIRENSIITGSFQRQKLELFQVIENRINVLKKLELDTLLSREYQKLFGAILRLHCEAKAAEDAETARMVKKVFQDKNREIARYGRLQGKNKLLQTAMSIHYSAINCVCVYRKAHMMLRNLFGRGNGNK